MTYVPPPAHPPPGSPGGRKQLGRPKGSRNKRTLLVEQLLEGELENMAAVLVKLARSGDVRAICEILNRVAPPRRGAPIVIAGFPRIESVSDVPAAMAKLAESVAAGETSPEEAASVASVLKEYVASVETVALAERVAELEKSLAQTD